MLLQHLLGKFLKYCHNIVTKYSENMSTFKHRTNKCVVTESSWNSNTAFRRNITHFALGSSMLILPVKTWINIIRIMDCLQYNKR